MTHSTEDTFTDAVAQWFREVYGADAVERQAYLDDERWFADLVVDAGWCTVYVEVEDDADGIRDGVGQAEAYAATNPLEGVPLVVVPEDHVEPDRIDTLRRVGGPIREFDAAAGAFV